MKLSDITSRILSEVGAAIQRAARTERQRPQPEPPPPPPPPRRPGRPRKAPAEELPTEESHPLVNVVNAMRRELAELREELAEVREQNAELAAQVEGGAESFFPEFIKEFKESRAELQRLSRSQHAAFQALQTCNEELQTCNEALQTLDDELTEYEQGREESRLSPEDEESGS
jgi:DNA repair exonuclease SbcCD ATPase subunit